MAQTFQFFFFCEIHFFYKQPIFKQLAIGWEIFKQFSGLNPISLSNNKNYRLKKGEVFPL